MKRVGFIIKVKENDIDDYKKHHQNVWPEMKSALKKNGWDNYSLFIRKDGLMFGYFEAKKSFADSFEIPEGAAPDQSMLELEEVFHID